MTYSLPWRSIRDSMLKVSGLLNDKMYGPQVPIKRGPDGQWLEDDKKALNGENRRSLYSNETVYGPYTTSLQEEREHSVAYTKTADEQYRESQKAKRYPKVIPGERKTIKPSDTGTATPAVQPTE